MDNMTTANELISGLVNALDAIARAAAKNEPYATSFIRGAAEQAIANTRAHQVRNADGYFVVESK